MFKTKSDNQTNAVIRKNDNKSNFNNVYIKKPNSNENNYENIRNIILEK